MSQRMWSVPANGFVVVRVRAAGLRLGKQFLPVHGQFGFTHCVSPTDALDLVRRRLANCAFTLRQLEEIVARQQPETAT